jgi:hypothetical protein
VRGIFGGSQRSAEDIVTAPPADQGVVGGRVPGPIGGTPAPVVAGDGLRQPEPGVSQGRNSEPRALVKGWAGVEVSIGAATGGAKRSTTRPAGPGPASCAGPLTAKARSNAIPGETVVVGDGVTALVGAGIVAASPSAKAAGASADDTSSRVAPSPIRSLRPMILVLRFSDPRSRATRRPSNPPRPTPSIARR